MIKVKHTARARGPKRARMNRYWEPDYNTGTGSWKQIYFGNGNNVVRYSGRMDDDARIFN